MSGKAGLGVHHEDICETCGETALLTQCVQHSGDIDDGTLQTETFKDMLGIQDAFDLRLL